MRWIVGARARLDAILTEAKWLAFRKQSRSLKTDMRIAVSLTSYPPRFKTLHLTLKTILLQSIRPCAVVLWIAKEDFHLLPVNVLLLEKWGLTIRICDNLRSYKKLIPALSAYKGLAVVTADDDVVYWKRWLADLASEYREGYPEILCHRMHVVKTDSEGLPAKYNDWQWCSESLQSSPLNFATGVGGVLYPPSAFDGEAVNVQKMAGLCPRGDDIWFYWMARSKGIFVRKVRSSGTIRFWRGSQDVALWKSNIESDENDAQIAAMLEEYGFERY
ncbi:glycosyltransferase family 2 protein [Paraburkholderia sp. BCC1886]|uniref:glycosyltransferase family 2 protein n=1 Tax=Paraburkholderia sp. BCC1886 TaxID=2562670 RepID=UPI001181DDC4|nr:glycosyltransferase family 2 protein [Paraburkholderia sp. BCC1886]